MPQPYSLLPTFGTDAVDEWIKLGLENHMQGKAADAERHYKYALKLEPNNTIASHNLAILWACNGHLGDGVLGMERACIFDGSNPIFYANLGLLYLESDRIDAAIDAATKSYNLALDKPDKEDPIATAGYLLARLVSAMVHTTSGGAPRALEMYNQMLEIEPGHPSAGPNSCFVQTLMNLTPKDLAEQRAKWYVVNKWQGRHWPSFKNEKNPDKPLKIGYVGGDFKSHSAAMMFANVVFHHDRANYEPYLYCSLPTDPEKDDMTAKFRAAANWRDIMGVSDDDAEAMIQEDGIDILVDLAGHTNGGRLGLFTRRPAPVSICAWGFAHGTGVPEIDYFLADPIAVPQEERQYFTEEVIDVPCIVTYREPIEYKLKGTTTLPFHRNGYFTFGSFSRFEKLSDECLATYAEILRRVPDSRLYIKDHAYKRPYSIQRVLSFMEGIDHGRVIFGGSHSHSEHLQEIQKVDLALDPWPHGGGIVTLETLYMGVPLLTLYGTQPSGRTAASVLTKMSRTGYIAKTKEDFVEKAVTLSQQTAALADLRKVLRDELMNSVVVKGYREAIEATYRQLWQRWCAK